MRTDLTFEVTRARTSDLKNVAKYLVYTVIIDLKNKRKIRGRPLDNAV